MKRKIKVPMKERQMRSRGRNVNMKTEGNVRMVRNVASGILNLHAKLALHKAGVSSAILVAIVMHGKAMVIVLEEMVANSDTL